MESRREQDPTVKRVLIREAERLSQGPSPPFNKPQERERALCAEVSLSFLRRAESPLRRGFLLPKGELKPLGTLFLREN